MMRYWLLSLVAALPAAAAGPNSFTDCSDCPQMISIAPGGATLGSSPQERASAGIIALFGDREEPTYAVNFARAFALGRNEVTRGEYRAFVEATKRPDGPTCGGHDAKTDSWIQRSGYNWRTPGFDQDDSHPAVCISYDDAVAYTQWLSKKTGKSYRLPSDAEWEYAARAGTKSAWYWGDSPEPGCAAANIISAGTAAGLGSPNSFVNRLTCASSRSFTMPVASFAPNPFGLYDMAGNTFEWAADCNAPDNKTAHSDGSARTDGDCARHYLKGGNFHTPFWLTRHGVRGAPLAADVHMFGVGFRVARSLD